MSDKQQKPVIWMGSSHEEWRSFPDEVQDVMGYALHLAQCGEKANNTKPLTGFKGASVMEITDEYDGNAYRAVYTVKFQDVVYVLHVFQKKSKKGITTPKSHIQLIEQRLKRAKEYHDQHYKK